MSSSEVGLERRAAQRFDFQLPLSVRLINGEGEGSGLTQDLSARGAFFYTDFVLEQGANVEVTLVMPSEITLSENMRVRCRGKVLRVTPPAIGNKIGVPARDTGGIHNFRRLQSHLSLARARGSRRGSGHEFANKWVPTFRSSLTSAAFGSALTGGMQLKK